MSKDPALYIIHIIESIERMEAFSECEEQEFLDDEKAYYAVLRNLQTMCEATQKLPDYIKTNHILIEWKKISAFRNILVHDYLGTYDKKSILDIVRNKLPEIKDAMIEELPNWEELKNKRDKCQ